MPPAAAASFPSSSPDQLADLFGARAKSTMGGDDTNDDDRNPFGENIFIKDEFSGCL